MSVRHRLQIAAVALVAAAGACKSDSSVAPLPQSQGLDLNQLFAQLFSPALSASSPLASVGATAPSIVPTNCVYTAASRNFVCAPGSVGGLAVTSSYTLLDASGAPQSSYSTTTTASVRTNIVAAGTITQPNVSLVTDTKQDLTLSGLLTGTHQLDGTSTLKVNGTANGLAVASNGTTTISKLILPPPTSTSKWPSSGTIVVDAATSLAGLPATPTKVELTFSGTSQVAAVVTVAGVTKRCTVDLATQAPTCA